MKNYKARIADKMLSRRLLGSGAVLIQGPKWCGKTTTAEQQAKSVAIDRTVYHYRDGNGLECDAVVHLRNGNYGLIEIKLGGEKNIEEGAKNLKLLASKIDDTKMKSPSFLMVLTGTSRYAVRRPDGVYVVPIGCLKD